MPRSAVPPPPCRPTTALPGAKTRRRTYAKVCKVDKYGPVVRLWSNSHFRGSFDHASGKVLQPEAHTTALYPAAALIPLPQEGKRGTESRREGGDGACDGTQRKADHSELFELEITEVILYSSTRERILYLVYTIC